MLTRRETHDARQILARLSRWDVALLETGDGVVAALQGAVEILTDVEGYLSALLHERPHTMTRLEDIADDLDAVAADMAHLSPPLTDGTVEDARRAYALSIAIFAVEHQADHLRQIAGQAPRHAAPEHAVQPARVRT